MYYVHGDVELINIIKKKQINKQTNIKTKQKTKNKQHTNNSKKCISILKYEKGYFFFINQNSISFINVTLFSNIMRV